MGGGHGHADEQSVFDRAPLADQVGSHHRLAVPRRERMQRSERNRERECDEGEPNRQPPSRDAVRE